MNTTRPQRTVAQKMGVKPMSRALLVDAPASAVEAMELPALRTAESREPDEEFDYVHLFALTQEQLDLAFPALRDQLTAGGMLWVSWPKGGRFSTDLTMKSVINIGYAHAMVESICLRVDATWAGLKFTHPKPGTKYANSYGTLPSQRG